MLLQGFEALRGEEGQLIEEMVPNIALTLYELLFSFLYLLLLLTFDLSPRLVLHFPLFYIFVKICELLNSKRFV